MKRKLQPLTRKQLTNTVEELEENVMELSEIVHGLQAHQPDYSGALILKLTEASDKCDTFYMVTKFHMDEPYTVFYHLVPVDKTIDLGIDSFPEKPSKQSTRAFIKDLEKSGKWNKIREQYFVPAVVRTQFTGHFTYTKHMDLEDIRADLAQKKADVLKFKNKPKRISPSSDESTD